LLSSNGGSGSALRLHVWLLALTDLLAHKVSHPIELH
jgi:hypothetical protein